MGSVCCASGNAGDAWLYGKAALRYRHAFDGMHDVAGEGRRFRTTGNHYPGRQGMQGPRHHAAVGAGNYPIPVPPGMTQSQFDNAVTNSGNNYNQGTYMPPGYGPNSNSAANNIIQNAGGTTPDVPGVWSQSQPAHSGGEYSGSTIPW